MNMKSQKAENPDESFLRREAESDPIEFQSNPPAIEEFYNLSRKTVLPDIHLTFLSKRKSFILRKKSPIFPEDRHQDREEQNPNCQGHS